MYHCTVDGTHAMHRFLEPFLPLEKLDWLGKLMPNGMFSLVQLMSNDPSSCRSTLHAVLFETRISQLSPLCLLVPNIALLSYVLYMLASSRL